MGLFFSTLLTHTTPPFPQHLSAFAVKEENKEFFFPLLISQEEKGEANTVSSTAVTQCPQGSVLGLVHHKHLPFLNAGVVQVAQGPPLTYNGQEQHGLKI